MSIIASFPNLINNPPFSITSPQTIRYNCIAWAYGIDNVPMWPNKQRFYWPPGIPKDFHIDSFIELFKSIGYDACSDGSFESGYIKIAIYTDDKGNPTHAARQLDSGFWTSKLGSFEDIMHTIDGMSGGVYGEVAQFMRKQTIT